MNAPTLAQVPRGAPDLSTPDLRMVAAIHHIRCQDCSACQEYAIDPESSPLCRLAFAMTTLRGTDPVRVRRLHDCKARGWVELDQGAWHVTKEGTKVVLRAAWLADHVHRRNQSRARRARPKP